MGGDHLWDAVGAIAEIIGALAVVVSLVYLATQIRIQNKESRSSAVREVIDGHRTSLSELHQPEMADIWVRGMADFDQLSPSESIRWVIYLRKL